MTASNGTQTPEQAPRSRLWVNWLLALSTIVGAGVVQLLAMGAVMSTSACSAPNCPKPSGFVYGLLTYGAPVVAVAAIVLSFFTARLPRGWLVPAVAWLLLILDVAILAVTFS
ncbi:hypothetical protein [Mycolicibacterium vinylchloridicum]|uniref:hypothetical protein n=1 Tax=Mycolicibacterium vinylchloridicum TaxID=2736928 RepID=UPI001C546362|nr:hypothetical protein [Mycolicibacterium vinylchloridicum]